MPMMVFRDGRVGIWNTLLAFTWDFKVVDTVGVVGRTVVRTGDSASGGRVQRCFGLEDWTTTTFHLDWSLVDDLFHVYGRVRTGTCDDDCRRTRREGDGRGLSVYGKGEGES